MAGRISHSRDAPHRLHSRGVSSVQCHRPDFPQKGFHKTGLLHFGQRTTKTAAERIATTIHNGYSKNFQYMHSQINNGSTVNIARRTSCAFLRRVMFSASNEVYMESFRL